VGILSDNNYYEVLKARILELGLEQNIHIYPNLAFNDILELYKNAKLFVLHTEEESQGIVFCEAMATGKPIVTTNVGGVPWVVENNVNGSLSNYGDIDTFANNVIKLLEFDTLCKIMADNNIKQSHKYEWKYISTEIIEVYKSII
jgi:glycosyltransferase involved in cell wall biosynthesis